MDELAQSEADVFTAGAMGTADGIGLKISKAGGLTPGRRQRDIARAAGMTVSVQDTVGSSIAFSGILQLGATVPDQLLRCVLNCEDMITIKTATVDATFIDGGVLPGTTPGLGIEVDEAILGTPVATWDELRAYSASLSARLVRLPTFHLGGYACSGSQLVTLHARGQRL